MGDADKQNAANYRRPKWLSNLRDGHGWEQGAGEPTNHPTLHCMGTYHAHLTQWAAVVLS